jgi:glycerophosphoryl diester phosphodiesterase
VQWIAHRAGNTTSSIAVAAAVADAIELDVHLFRGRLEVRHGKVLWPLARLWEQWELLPADAPRPALDEIVDAAPEGCHLWLDLKGFTPRLTRRALGELNGRRPVTLSARSWWILRGFGHLDGVRAMRSVGNRTQRWAATVLPGHGGIVIHERLVDREWLARLRRRAPEVIAWGVTDRRRAAELTDLGIDGLIVDDLTLITRRPPI